MRKNLIIVRAGEDSRHAGWLGERQERDFDLLVSYFGATPDRYRSDADHYHVMTGPRWPAHHVICQDLWDIIERYEYIAFVCDDIEAPVGTWNELFAVCREYQLALAQPSILGHVNWPITCPQEGSRLRFTNQVECMCPVFHRPVLANLRWTLGESAAGWPLSRLWSRLLPWPHYRTAIIDAVRVRHARPAEAGTLYAALQSRGINAREELGAVSTKYELEPYQAKREYAWVPLTSSPHAPIVERRRIVSHFTTAPVHRRVWWRVRSLLRKTWHACAPQDGAGKRAPQR